MWKKSVVRSSVDCADGTTGSIRAKNDLGAECLNLVTFQVTMSDGYNPPVGPMPVHVTLEGSYSTEAAPFSSSSSSSAAAAAIAIREN